MFLVLLTQHPQAPCDLSVPRLLVTPAPGLGSSCVFQGRWQHCLGPKLGDNLPLPAPPVSAQQVDVPQGLAGRLPGPSPVLSVDPIPVSSLLARALLILSGPLQKLPRGPLSFCPGLCPWGQRHNPSVCSCHCLGWEPGGSLLPGEGARLSPEPLTMLRSRASACPSGLVFPGIVCVLDSLTSYLSLDKAAMFRPPCFHSRVHWSLPTSLPGEWQLILQYPAPSLFSVKLCTASTSPQQQLPCCTATSCSSFGRN